MLPMRQGNSEKSNCINEGIRGTGISQKNRTLAIAARIAVVASHLLLEIELFIKSILFLSRLYCRYKNFTCSAPYKKFAAFADFTAGEEFHLPSKNYLIIDIII